MRHQVIESLSHYVVLRINYWIVSPPHPVIIYYGYLMTAQLNDLMTAKPNDHLTTDN
jgi:hypothetical protein